MRYLILAIAMILGLNQSAFAQSDGAFDVALKKNDEKKASRWSLADWLAQKERNRKMDFWLAQNTHSSNYEFFLEARSINYGESDGSPTATAKNNNVYGGALAAYAGVAGLRGSLDQDSEKRSVWSGSLNLRLIGGAIQDSHLNLEYGLRGTSVTDSAGAKDSYQNQFGGVSLNLYLAKFFGIEGSYQRLLPTQSERHRSMEGEDSRAGVFIDFNLLRVFGYWRNEFLDYDGGGQADESEFRQGYGGGLRLYF
jgi:hypothetical protein